MTTVARFQLYVKAGSDGKSLGDCPFSQRANMFARMKLDPSDIEVIYVDTTNKPEYFLNINPDGKVPVMIDNKVNKVIADSGDITKYISDLVAGKTEALNEKLASEAGEACSGIFPKFAGMMKNKDTSKDGELKEALTAELGKLNSFLEDNKTNGKFLMGDSMCDLDCQVLPKLKHVQVAGKEWKNYNIPSEFTALLEYINSGYDTDEFKFTCPGDEQFVWGWKKFM